MIGQLTYFQDRPDSTSTTSNSTTSSTGQTGNNLTEQVAQQLSSLTAGTDGSDQQVSVDQLKNIISGTVSKQFSDSDLPAIDPNDIKIKKQNYTGTAAQIQTKKKEDFINYIVAVYYIISSSSPKPITNNDDVSSLSNYMIQTIANSLTTRDSSQLNDLSKSGQKILDQLKDVEVPEDVLNIHVKGLQFAKYAIALKPDVDANTADPMADLVNISKMESFIEAMISFSSEIETKFNEYGVSYDDVIKNKLQALGVTPPEVDGSIIQAVTGSSTDTTSATDYSTDTSAASDTSTSSSDNTTDTSSTSSNTANTSDNSTSDTTTP